MRRRTRPGARNHGRGRREFDDDFWPEPPAPELTADVDEAEAPEASLPPAGEGPPEPLGRRELLPTRELIRRVRRSEGFDARLAATVAVSLLLHLSAITLFRVVVYLPARGERVYHLQLVAAPATPAPAPPLDLAALDGGLRISGRDPLAEEMPALELPTVEFSGLERLRIRQQSLDVPDALPALRQPGLDSWQRFGQGIEALRDVLRGGDAAPLAGEAPSPAPPVVPSQTQALGGNFELEVRWPGARAARPLLYAPPIPALSAAQPGELPDNLEFIVTINQTGRVTSVWTPVVEESELVDSIQAGVLRFTFEPADAETTQEQTAVLRIRTAPGGSP